MTTCAARSAAAGLAAACFAAAAAALPSRAAADDAAGERPVIRAVGSLAAGPLVGLDAPLRGAAFAAEAGLRYGWLAALCRGTALWDARLGAPALRLDLGLAFGPDLRLLVGGELPLGRQEAAIGDISVPVAPQAFPCRFGLGATVARILPSRGPRPGLAVEAEFAWTAYRASGREGPLPAAAAGAAGFAAGFSALVALALCWR